jgi:hypothetical protein
MADAGDSHLIEAASLALAIKERIEGGDLGPHVKWREWMLQNIPLKSSRLYELLRIGSAADPAAELARIRSENRNRQSKARNQRHDKIDKLTPEQRFHVGWAMGASASDLLFIRVHILKLMKNETT